jgi:hypothetical protein
MKKAILIEKLNDIRDKVDVVRHATLIMDLDHIYGKEAKADSHGA